MRAFARHRVIQFAAMFLLAWITVDFCWPDACAGDAFDVPGAPASFSESGDGTHGLTGLLHPDHCFCHARSITLAAAAEVSAPAQSAGVCLSRADTVTSQAQPPVYHPPQSAA